MPTDPAAGTANPAAAFWRFSLTLYARPGVAHALLALQDRCGRDVNLILYALWLGTRCLRLHAEEFREAASAIAALNDAVTGLRRQRRQLRDASDPDVMALRRRLLRAELEAERRVQYRLAARLRTGVLGVSEIGTGPNRFDTAAANLALCLGAEAHSPETKVVREALASLIRRP